jgi:hypothetical protein
VEVELQAWQVRFLPWLERLASREWDWASQQSLGLAWLAWQGPQQVAWLVWAQEPELQRAWLEFRPSREASPEPAWQR